MNKKIVFYIDDMTRGGAQRVMSVLLNYYINKNYDVYLVNDYKLKDESKEYTISNKIKRIYLREDLNGNLVIKNIQRIKILRKEIKSIHPDFVLSFLGNPNIRMLISTLGLKVNKYVSVRNDPNKEYGTNLLKKIFVNMLFLTSDGCVFQTEDASKYFFKSIQKKSKVIFNPVDDKFYNIKKLKQRKNIISVGRLEPQKNHKLLIDAFENVKDTIEDNLVIYGEGNLKKELIEYVKEKKLDNRIIFKGNVDNIEEELSKSKIFILSSDYEGMPNALMEAMTVGLPCISTDCPCGGPRSLILNEKQGLLVKTNDVSELSSAIINLLNCNYDKIGDDARKRALEFKTDVILKQWDNYLFNKKGE